MVLDLRIEHAHRQIPVALLVDDPAPCVNPYYHHRRLRQPTGELRLASGEAIVPTIPLAFLHDFADVVERHGLRGKFSVLPYPCNLGFIGRGLAGFPEAECRDWVAAVRQRLSPWLDFSPEVITHLYAVNPETLEPLDEDENAWSQHQDEETLTRYLSTALRLLAEAGIDASGVTSPWMFGERVEGAYARAVGNAQREVHQRLLTWHFLRSDRLSPQVPPVVADGDGTAGTAVVHVRPAWGDAFWCTQDTLAAGEAYVSSVVRCPDHTRPGRGSHPDLGDGRGRRRPADPLAIALLAGPRHGSAGTGRDRPTAPGRLRPPARMAILYGAGRLHRDDRDAALARGPRRQHPPPDPGLALRLPRPHRLLALSTPAPPRVPVRGWRRQRQDARRALPPVEPPVAPAHGWLHLAGRPCLRLRQSGRGHRGGHRGVKRR